jgi:hypothetical protein
MELTATSGHGPSNPTQNETGPAAPAPPDGAPLVPFLSIARGHPSAEEIAAVVAVLCTRARPAGEPAAGASLRSEWCARSRLMRSPLEAGPGGWRASGLPHG